MLVNVHDFVRFVDHHRFAVGAHFRLVRGAREKAWKVIDNTSMLSITANLGDVKSTITHPATTTHGRLSDEQRAQSGITEGLIRVAVGLESIEDIIADIEQGLAA